MSDIVDVLVAKLKARYLVETDQDLAKALKLGRSTVATWRNRGSVPKKYEALANGKQVRSFYGETPWEFWNELERAGMELAFLRLMRDFGDVSREYSAYLKRGSSIPVSIPEYHGAACHDIAVEMADHNETNVRACLQRIVYNEFFGC